MCLLGQSGSGANLSFAWPGSPGLDPIPISVPTPLRGELVLVIWRTRRAGNVSHPGDLHWASADLLGPGLTHLLVRLRVAQFASQDLGEDKFPVLDFQEMSKEVPDVVQLTGLASTGFRQDEPVSGIDHKHALGTVRLQVQGDVRTVTFASLECR